MISEFTETAIDITQTELKEAETVTGDEEKRTDRPTREFDHFRSRQHAGK